MSFQKKILEELSIILNITSNGFDHNHHNWIILRSLKNIKTLANKLIDENEQLKDQIKKLKATKDELPLNQERKYKAKKTNE